MNFLAHCFLSFHDEDVLFGNFIGDFVKGRQWELLPPRIGLGVRLHRAIDAYTDAHPAVLSAKARIRPYAGRYAGPVVDLFMDHLLSRNWALYTEDSRDEFLDFVYEILTRRQPEAPAVLRVRLPYMLKGRFLHEYSDEAGMLQVFERFSQRIPLEESGKEVVGQFFAFLPEYEEEFNTFFPALQEHLIPYR